MSNVYSVVLARIPAGFAGVHVIGPPPSGSKWSIVSMDAVCAGGVTRYLSGFRIFDEGGTDLWTIGPPFAQRHFPYHWDGRQVIDNAESFTVQPYDNDWAFRISGYELVLP